MTALSEKHIDLLARQYIEVGNAATYEGLATEFRNRAGRAFADGQDVQAKFYRDLATEMVDRGTRARGEQAKAKVELDKVTGVIEHPFLQGHPSGNAYCARVLSDGHTVCGKRSEDPIHTGMGGRF